MTPFASRKLPRFEDHHGIHRLLSHVEVVYLSSLPRPHQTQAGTAQSLRRKELVAREAIAFDPVTSGFPDCYVLFEFDRLAASPAIHLGPGAVSVRE